MKVKESRIECFIVVALVYMIAALVGIITYAILPLDMWLRLFIADVAATAATFIFSVIFNNASIYDPYWSVQPIVIVVAFAAVYSFDIVKLLMVIVICLWGIRLTANWAYTFANLSHQDWRYTMLKEKTGKAYPIINFVGIHLVPTIVVYACVLPAVYVITAVGALNAWAIIFLAISLGAAIMQGFADCQMHKFRKYRKPEDTFIRVGLWKHSRHPNYLGEILMWWGIGLAAIVALEGMWYLIIGAILNTILFLCVSIPMADQKQSKKAGFDEYKKQTYMLLPLPKLKK